MTDAEKRAIEKVVNRAANAIRHVVSAIEEYSGTIEEATKSFSHLMKVVNSTHVRTRAALLNKNTPMDEVFSLDTETDKVIQLASAVDQEPALAPIEATPPAPAPAPAAPAKPKWVRPAGRLAGTKEPVYEGTPDKPDAAALTAEFSEKGLIKDAGFVS